MTIGDDGIASLHMGHTPETCPYKEYKFMGNDETAPQLIKAVEATFGPLGIDLACTRENAKAPYGLYYPDTDALKLPWYELASGDLGWLNPPIIPNPDTWDWIVKCAEEAKKGARILLIIEAAFDTAAFWQHVWPNAAVYMLHPRMNYDSRNVPLMLAAFNARHLGEGDSSGGRELYLWLWSSNVVLKGLK